MVKLKTLRVERTSLTIQVGVGAAITTSPEVISKLVKVPRTVHGRLRLEHMSGSWGIADDPVDENLTLFVNVGDGEVPLGGLVGFPTDSVWRDAAAYRVLTGVGVIDTMRPIEYQDESPTWFSSDSDQTGRDEMQVVADSTTTSTVLVHATLEIIVEMNHLGSSDRESPLSRFMKQVMM